MKFTAEKGQVMEIYCDWLKNNCERYEYLTNEARELCLKIKGVDSQSMEAKEYYLKFLSMFINNPFVVASRLCKSRADQTDQSEKQIVSMDYRCYFIKNRYDMWLPLELYCRLAIYRNDGELAQMQEQEQIKLSEDYQAYRKLSDSQEEIWRAEKESWQECFVSFLKGPREVKSHPIAAILTICFAGMILLRLYQSYKEGFLPELLCKGGQYAAIVAVIGLFAVHVIIQGFLEFGNIFIKRKVHSHIRQAEGAKETVRERVKGAEGITEDLREFVTKMLKCGKEGIVEAEILKKGTICTEDEAAYEKYEAMAAHLKGIKKNIKPHTRLRYLVILLIFVFVLSFLGIVTYDYRFLMPGEHREERTEETGASGDGIGEQLTVRVEPGRIDGIVFVNGSVVSEESYYQNGRIKSLTVSAGEQEWNFDLPDVYDLEGTDLPFEEAFEAEERTFRIDAVYRGTVYQDTCIAEIIIYGERLGG
ncbi:MAG: hypothetical protein HFG70_00785 [Hungatella sp.]|nr:hypothetical protein [Hungatella sp.]